MKSEPEILHFSKDYSTFKRKYLKILKLLDMKLVDALEHTTIAGRKSTVAGERHLAPVVRKVSSASHWMKIS